MPVDEDVEIDISDRPEDDPAFIDVNDEEEEDFDNGLDYEDEMNSRGSMDFEETPNEFSDEQFGTPTTDEAP